LQHSLLTAFRQCLPCTCQVPDQLEDILSRHLPLGVLTDLAAYALPLDLEVKHQLLAERRVVCRAQALLAEFQKMSVGSSRQTTAGKFPPLFSAN
jgi:hypothetical protein